MSLVNNANRDVFVGEIANNLKEEKEITLFGFGYYEKGNIQYFFSADETNIFWVHQNKMIKRIICTPIEMITQKSSTHTQGQIESKLEDILSYKYSKNYFLFLTYFNDLESNDSSQPILENYLNTFSNETENSLQQANYNLISLAYYSKQLNETSYNKLLKKIYYVETDELKNIHRLDFRHFVGIGYFLPNKAIAFYSNAYLPNVIKKKNELENENHIVSPIFQKSYDLSDIKNNSIKMVKEDFTRILEQTINSNYLAVIQELKSLSPAIKNNLFTTQLNKIKSNLTEDSLKAITLYANIWSGN